MNIKIDFGIFGPIVVKIFKVQIVQWVKKIWVIFIGRVCLYFNQPT
jgi:hypothetical protein